MNASGGWLRIFICCKERQLHWEKTNRGCPLYWNTWLEEKAALVANGALAQWSQKVSFAQAVNPQADQIVQSAIIPCMATEGNKVLLTLLSRWLWESCNLEVAEVELEKQWSQRTWEWQPDTRSGGLSIVYIGDWLQRATRGAFALKVAELGKNMLVYWRNLTMIRPLPGVNIQDHQMNLT
jgi:hypothetical protein